MLETEHADVAYRPGGPASAGRAEPLTGILDQWHASLIGQAAHLAQIWHVPLHVHRYDRRNPGTQACGEIRQIDAERVGDVERLGYRAERDDRRSGRDEGVGRYQNPCPGAHSDGPQRGAKGSRPAARRHGTIDAQPCRHGTFQPTVP